jgi:hypothetical protein
LYLALLGTIIWKTASCCTRYNIFFFTSGRKRAQKLPE